MIESDSIFPVTTPSRKFGTTASSRRCSSVSIPQRRVVGRRRFEELEVNTLEFRKGSRFIGVVNLVGYEERGRQLPGPQNSVMWVSCDK